MDSRLIVIDSKNKTVRQLKIDCDTMAEVTVLGMLGNPVGTTQMQISLAHGFGDGREESCGYARDAVSRLLQGESIDFYRAQSGGLRQLYGPQVLQILLKVWKVWILQKVL